MTRQWPRSILLGVIVLVLLVGCSGGQGGGEGIDHQSDYWPTGGWRTSTPEAQGIDSEMLAEMLDTIQQRGYSIDSVSIVRNGYLVADAYFYPFDRDSRHIIHSCTKSINAALVGIAIEQGYLEGVDQAVLDIFAERNVANVDARKQAMTLEDLLTMSSGLDCQDSYLYRWRGLSEMRRSADWVQHMLDLPMAHEPGAYFEYCNGGSYLLAAVVQQASGTTALDFGRKHLFGPLGIEEVEWPASPQGINLGWGEMRLRPHDMAKFGYLYLHHGTWDGQQVVPAWWADASTQARVSAGTLSDDYGYQWWVDAGDYYMALGYAGQYIVVVSELEMVVVFTSDLEEKDFFVPETLLRTYILPAATKSGPLPENPDGVARLQAFTEAVASPRP